MSTWHNRQTECRLRRMRKYHTRNHITDAFHVIHVLECIGRSSTVEMGTCPLVCLRVCPCWIYHPAPAEGREQTCSYLFTHRGQSYIAQQQNPAKGLSIHMYKHSYDGRKATEIHNSAANRAILFIERLWSANSGRMQRIRVFVYYHICAWCIYKLAGIHFQPTQTRNLFSPTNWFSRVINIRTFSPQAFEAQHRRR